MEKISFDPTFLAQNCGRDDALKLLEGLKHNDSLKFGERLELNKFIRQLWDVSKDISLNEDEKNLIQSGNNIAALKSVHTRCLLGLVEAKNAVEAYSKQLNQKTGMKLPNRIYHKYSGCIIEKYNGPKKTFSLGGGLYDDIDPGDYASPGVSFGLTPSCKISAKELEDNPDHWESRD